MDRKPGWTRDSHGEPRACPRRPVRGRLFLRVFPHPFATPTARDPALARRYVRSRARRILGSRDLSVAMDTCLALIHDHASRLDGIKISLLDARREIDMRRRLPAGVRLYTGDDFNYDTLILGDGAHHSDALLGIFDAIAPAASAAIQGLDNGRAGEFSRILAPTIPLSRLIFETPTYLYKTGIVFLAWLNGHQDQFRMVGGLETARSMEHLSKLLVLAEQAGVLRDPDLACSRMQTLLAGVAAR